MIFATPFESPVYFGHPLGLVAAIDSRQQLYFERVYVGTTVIRSTPITERGLVYLQEAGPLPSGCTHIHASITNIDRKTEADPVASTTVVQQKALFSTPFDSPVLFAGYPVKLGIAIGETRQALFLDREYKAGSTTLEIRSDIITERGAMSDFNIHHMPPPYGTSKILVSIRNEYRATATALEYTIQEHNQAEYN
jgi:hypothetical protein